MASNPVAVAFEAIWFVNQRLQYTLLVLQQVSAWEALQEEGHRQIWSTGCKLATLLIAVLSACPKLRSIDSFSKDVISDIIKK